MLLFSAKAYATEPGATSANNPIDFKTNTHPIDPQCLRVEVAFASNDVATLRDAAITQTYWEALRQFRLAAAYIPIKNHAAARRAIRSGLEVVALELKRDPDQTHLLIIGAMLDGQYLLLSPWRFFHNGRRGLSRMRRAQTLDPTNPRLALLQSTAKILLPRLLGGDPQAGAKQIAATLAATGPTNTTFDQTPLCAAGAWAQVDLLNWLGRAHAKLGQHEQAQQAWQRALARSPKNYWVKLAIQGQGYQWRYED